VYKLDVYLGHNSIPTAILEPLSVKREWMDRYNGSEYHCFPVTLSNRLGWAVSFPKDISFVWNGDTTPNKEECTTILAGEEYCWNQRGMGAITLNTNLIFKSDENTSLLTLPVPNQFIDGLQVFTSIMSSSFYTGGLQIVLQLTSPGKTVLIPANTPIATLVPISLTQFENAEMTIHEEEWPFTKIHNSEEYNEGIWKLKNEAHNEMSNCYSRAVDHKGNKIGNHQIKRFNFTVKRRNKNEPK
jgi:hypothetical protein